MELTKITEYLDSLINRGIPSVDCMIYKEHELVYRHMAGYREISKSMAVDGNELYLMFSMTKVVTMTAIMQLIEQGKVSLEDEVSKYLPAYGQLSVLKDGKECKLEEPLKIWHLVSMQSGLDYDLNRKGIVEILEQKKDCATTQEIVNAFVKTPLCFVPGTRYQYSLSHDVIGAIIEVVTGKSFGTYLQEHVFTPLKMTHTRFAKPMNYDKNLAMQFEMNDQGIFPMEPSCNYQLSSSYESGGAGLMSCTEDFAILADCLASGGVSKDGIQILKAETIEKMKENLLGEQSREDIANTMGRVGYGYGCGVQVLLEPEKIGSTAPKGVFGWDGAAGSCIIMDTASKVSVVYTQHVRNCGIAYGEIHPTLRDMVFGSN